MSNATEDVSWLLSYGISKYHISKKLGVSWNTVNRWSQAISKPRQTFAITLKEWRETLEGSDS